MNPTQPAAAAPAWGLDGCLDDPSIRLLLWIVAGLLALAVAVVTTLIATGRVTGKLRSELVARTASWLAIAPAVVMPVLAGRVPTTLLVLLLSLLCFREFARATGLASDPLMSILVVLTTSMVLVVGPHVFRSELQEQRHLLAIGLLVSCLGILGDLTMSSVKRDVGIKDMGAVIPGHGGVLDRCNSLLLAAPALFHYIGYFHGFGQGQPQRILTGP